MIYIVCALIFAILLAVFVLVFLRKEKNTLAADIDLRGHQRPRLTVRLPKRLSTLTLTTPTKALSDSLSPIGALLDSIGSGDVSNKNMRELYRYCALILGTNLENKTISQARLQATLTPDDCLDFLNQYLTWLGDLTTAKN